MGFTKLALRLSRQALRILKLTRAKGGVAGPQGLITEHRGPGECWGKDHVTEKLFPSPFVLTCVSCGKVGTAGSEEGRAELSCVFFLSHLRAMFHPLCGAGLGEQGRAGDRQNMAEPRPHLHTAEQQAVPEGKAAVASGL